MKEVEETKESLIAILNDAYKKASKIHNQALKKWNEIELDMSDVENLSIAGAPAAKILQISLEATDKILKVATLLKDVVIDKDGRGGAEHRDLNDIMTEAMDELDKEGS